MKDVFTCLISSNVLKVDFHHGWDHVKYYQALFNATGEISKRTFNMRDWALGTPEGDWTSMGVYSDGSYGIEKGLIYSFPCVCKDGDWEIVQGVEVNDFSVEKMKATEQELVEERDAVAHLLP